ncbi:MAG: hypothetical protein EP298_07820 [Gammaproteobacteria bacterium]|nr:MAG: hypothetical protein EP298_07820 [Gammaproteobacteria bacterium]UTW44022.1 patatin-like phospholipase family protein [bacterium SCSIO 12844]
MFSYKNTPNVKIALATKASAALPVILQPVKIKGVEYVDGGYYDNIQTECFNNLFNNKVIPILFFSSENSISYKVVNSKGSMDFSIDYDEQF